MVFTSKPQHQHQHQHHGARVVCRRRGDIAISDYSGVLCQTSFEWLRPRVVQSSAGALCAVIRMDKTLSLMTTAPQAAQYPAFSIPGAVIVRADQYDLWADYAQAMASVNIRRAVFLDSQLGVCRQWVDWQLE